MADDIESDNDNNRGSFSIENVDVADDEKEIHQTLLSPQDASSLQRKLFELFQSADIDKNELIDFDEFTSVINKFLPNTKESKLKEMFDTLDENNDGNISYQEFLKEENFNHFLKYCGYITYHAATATPREQRQSITDLVNNSHINRAISVRNAHDAQIIVELEEQIDKLNLWINEEGKPAQYKVQTLELEVESMQQIVNKKEIELSVKNSELTTLREEKIATETDLNAIMNEKRNLEQQLKVKDDELDKLQISLEEYYEKSKQFDKLQNELDDFKKDNENIKNENLIILERNKQFENKNSTLNNILKEKDKKLMNVKQERDELDEKYNQCIDDIDTLQEQINEKNEQIDDLQQKFSLANDGDTFRPQAASDHIAKTIRRDIGQMNKTMRDGSMVDDFSMLNTGNIGSGFTFRGQGDTLRDGGGFMIYEDTEHDGGGFHQGNTQHDVGSNDDVDFNAMNDKSRPSNQSIDENRENLQQKLFEYQQKEKSLIKAKEDMENENKSYINKYDELAMKYDELEKQLKEERIAHQREMEEQKKKQKEAKETEEKEEKNNVIISGKSDTEDENQPLMMQNDNRRKRPKKSETPQPTCVCFGFPVW